MDKAKREMLVKLFLQIEKNVRRKPGLVCPVPAIVRRKGKQ